MLQNHTQQPYIVFSNDGRTVEITGVYEDLTDAKASFVPVYIMTPSLAIHDADTYMQLHISIDTYFTDNDWTSSYTFRQDSLWLMEQVKK